MQLARILDETRKNIQTSELLCQRGNIAVTFMTDNVKSVET
jgi:hypothetical protein